jgi:hypothetical protein
MSQLIKCSSSGILKWFLTSCLLASSAWAQDVAPEPKQGEIIAKASFSMFPSLYPGSGHRLIKYCVEEGTVELEDGSTYWVEAGDFYNLLYWIDHYQWGLADLVHLKQNNAVNYPLLIENQISKTSIRVYLRLGPWEDGVCNHTIDDLNHSTGEVWLRDGSYWKIAGYSKDVFSKFRPGDTVIIGVNDSWFYPNFLHNVNLNRPVAAAFWQ